MFVYRGFRPLPGAARGAIAAIGNFDGVHLGHKHLLSRAHALGQSIGAAGLAAITFEPHPRDVVRPGQPTPRLSSARRKLELLRAAGVDQVMVLPFVPRLMQMPPEAFVQDVLADQFGLAGVMSGQGFRFGHKRRGDCAFLSEHAGALGMTVRAVAPFYVEGSPCSSSRVREALSHGDIGMANRLLGRAHEILGVVRTGDRRGRELGFPTANTYPIPAETALPSTGIYVVSAQVFGELGSPWLDAVASLGRNPTFGGSEVRLEVHILDHHGLNLYGKRLRVAFHQRLRGEEAYDGVEALVAQIAKDCDQARRIHAARKASPPPIS